MATVQHKGDRPRTREAIRRRNRKKRDQKIKIFREAKNKPCADCGESYPYYVMQFDHVPERGPKLVSLNYGTITRSIGLARIRAELEKCDVVCANCHAERTWGRLQEKPPV